MGRKGKWSDKCRESIRIDICGVYTPGKEWVGISTWRFYQGYLPALTNKGVGIDRTGLVLALVPWNGKRV